MSARQVEPHLFVIFGATGDLTRRKLLPALFRLTHGDDPPPLDRYAILGVGRKDVDDRAFRDWVGDGMEESGLSRNEIDAWCTGHVHYHQAGGQETEDFETLKERIEALESELKLTGNRVFYLALPPPVFPTAISSLGGSGLNRGPGWTRLVIEKPFGDSLESAKRLNELLHTHFDESQVYRIDHYLGKETVQNLLVFRFANSIFESLWNRDRVECVQITVAESLGVEMRAGYYDRAGALRDMMQNHVTQLVSLIGMEVPAAFSADAVRYEKIKLLRGISPIQAEDVAFGQYTRGVVDEEEVKGYRDEPGVANDSRTETFAAMRLQLDTWRWQGVPFYIRTGKRLPRRVTQIAIVFRREPVSLFAAAGARDTNPNVLLLTLQPDEGFNLCFDVKVPGEPFRLRTLPLHFLYKEAFAPSADAYQTLLLDVLTGDQTLFVHADETEASWALYTPLLEQKLPVHHYAAGSWGPTEADHLLERHGHAWMEPLETGRYHGATHTDLP